MLVYSKEFEILKIAIGSDFRSIYIWSNLESASLGQPEREFVIFQTFKNRGLHQFFGQ